MDLLANIEYILPLLFFVVAFVYSSVGLGGGSSYTALMIVVGMSTVAIPMVSLALNVLVTTIGSYNYLRNNHGKINIILPFLVTAIPFSYLGGSITLPREIFMWVMLASLIVVAARIYFWKNTGLNLELNSNQKMIISLFAGSILGLVAGIVGIGGGVYLVPLIIVLNLGTAKEAASAGVVFVWMVSISGLISRLQYNSIDLLEHIPLMVAVALGGALGSYLGAFKFSSGRVEKVLGFVILIAIGLLIKKLVF